jgi:hypothetical protein
MLRYSVSYFTFMVPIAYGKLEVRISCPTCDSLHAGIPDGADSHCIGCGQTLTVRGHELLVSVMPDDVVPDKDGPSEDKPDYPTFWYGDSP